MPTHMDKLLALRMFVETVRCGGYSAAARKLGLAASSVTRQVAALEAQLGAALLNRNTRQSVPTEAGQAYYLQALAILEAIARADTAVNDRGPEARGLLRVSVPVEFGRRVIAPYIGELLEAQPALEISLSLSDERIDLLQQTIDLCVRLGDVLPSEDVICKVVGRFERWVVASPGYLARAQPLSVPLDLAGHACLRFDYGGGPRQWLFSREGEALRIDVSGRLLSNNADVLKSAALAGGGVALLANWLVEEEVAQGRLVRLFAGYQVNPGRGSDGINVLFLPNHRDSARVRAFVEFLRQRLG